MYPDPTGEITSGFIKLFGSLVTAALDAVKVTRFSEVEIMSHSAQSRTVEFEWQPDAKEDAGVALGDVTCILSLFAHDKEA